MGIKISNNKLLVLLVIVLVSTSCNKGSFDDSDVDCYTYDYSDCETQRPREAEVDFFFTINNNFNWVPFELYKGNVDNGELILRDTAWNSKVTYVMPIPETYSVRAIYERNGETIYTVDGDRLDVLSKQVCDSICWTINVDNFDLRLH